MFVALSQRNKQSWILFKTFNFSYFARKPFQTLIRWTIIDDRCLTTAYIVFLGGNPISWTSKKRKLASKSSTEAEYQALAYDIAKLCWKESPLKELGVILQSSPMLYSDNLGASYLCFNPLFHSKMKHVDADFHFARERVASGSLHIAHV